MNEEAKYVPTKYDSVFWIDVDKIKPNPFQPRREFTEEGLKALAESIRQYGILQPLTVTRNDVEKDDGGLGSEYELIEQFGITQAECAAKIGKSREYVANSLRLLTLPEDMQDAIVNREISEGHARALLALNSRPEERETLFKEITLKKLSVRAAERIARSIAQERVRSHHRKSPEMVEIEKSLTETLGTRVIIETNAEGGRLLIDFFSPEDLSTLAGILAAREAAVLATTNNEAPLAVAGNDEMPHYPNTTLVDPVTAAAPEEPHDGDEELYSISNFSV